MRLHFCDIVHILNNVIKDFIINIFKRWWIVTKKSKNKVYTKKTKNEISDNSDIVGSKKLRAASFSIIVNAFLISMKAVVALITGSLAILAELAHSFFDIIASIFAYVGIKKAIEPADGSHLYGHEKFENLSSFAQTILIVVTSVLIVYEAINRIIVPKKLEATEIGLVVMLVIIGIDYFLSRYLHKSSKQYGSSALEADAYHFTTDLWGALAVIIRAHLRISRVSNLRCYCCNSCCNTNAPDII